METYAERECAPVRRGRAACAERVRYGAPSLTRSSYCSFALADVYLLPLI